MGRFFRVNKKSLGSPPGEILRDSQIAPALVRVMAYNSATCEERESDELPEMEEGVVNWIDVVGLNPGFLSEAGKKLELNPLAMEDILNTGHRPKMEELDEKILVILKMIDYNSENSLIEIEQVSLLMTKEGVITFQEREGDVFGMIRERIRKKKGRIRAEGAAYLLYALLDAVVDHIFLVLEKIAEDMESLEEKILENPGEEIPVQLHTLKRELIFLRKSLWPLREVVGGLKRGEHEKRESPYTLYYNDLYDHIIQIIDTVESLRDVVTGLFDIYLSTMSHRMNQVMKILTIIATIFIPLTFIAGVYGMNFKEMPELEWSFGYPLALGVMISIGLAMVGYFKKKKWF